MFRQRNFMHDKQSGYSKVTQETVQFIRMRMALFMLLLILVMLLIMFTINYKEVYCGKKGIFQLSL
jgi:uncharacterized integral membrane protein